MWLIGALGLHDRERIFELMYALAHLRYSTVQMLCRGEHETRGIFVHEGGSRARTKKKRDNAPSALSCRETAYNEVSTLRPPWKGTGAIYRSDIEQHNPGARWGGGMNTEGERGAREVRT